MAVGDETDFSQAILEEARQEADGIVDLARREAERILDGAREELEKIYIVESPQTKTQQAAARYDQIIASAELETRRNVLLVRERCIQEVQEQVFTRLRDLCTDTRYPEILQMLIKQGLQELEGEAFEVIVASQDRDLVTDTMLSQIREDTGKAVALAKESADQSREGMVGVIIQRTDQRVMCDNSFQAIIQREQYDLRLLIATELFGEAEYE